MIGGTLILVFGTMMTSISTQYYQYILAQGILVGVGIGTVYVYVSLAHGIPAHDGCSFYPSLSAISTYFQRYRSTALGVALTGSGVGGVAWPIMYQQLFARVGFAWTVRISGFVTLALCGVAIATVSSNLSRPRERMPWLDTKIFRDLTFVLLVVGSLFICLGARIITLAST